MKDKVLISVLFNAWKKEVKKVKNLKEKIINYFSINKVHTLITVFSYKEKSKNPRFLNK